MPALTGPLPIDLPRLAPDTALIVAAIVVLVAIAVLARVLLAYGGLGRRAAAARATADRLEAGQATLPDRMAALRARARELNSGAERALWALPRFDARIDEVRQTLADDRVLLDELRRDDGEALRGTLERIRGTLSLLGTASELRRKIRA